MSDAPELFGWPTANVALLVSIIAVLLAASSTIIGVKTYSRANARIVVEAQRALRIIRIGDRPPRRLGTVQVTVRNRGLAAMTIDSVRWQRKKARWRRFPKEVARVDMLSGSPKLPRQIESNTSEDFTFNQKFLREAADGCAYLRAQVRLATGERRYSNALRLGPTKSVNTDTEAD